MDFIRNALKAEYAIPNATNNYLGYYTPPTALEANLRPTTQNIDIKAVLVSRGYRIELTDTTDIFHVFTEETISFLQQRKCLLFIDNAVEGHSEFEYPLIRAIYHSCTLYNIDADLVFLVDGNLKSETVNTCIVKILGLPKSINIISVNGCEHFVLKNYKTTYFEARSKCMSSDSEMLMLSLSRRARGYRNLAQYIICHSDLLRKTILSQDRVHHGLVTMNKKDDYDNEIDVDNVQHWTECLPIRADNTDFEYNYAQDLNQDLYDQTIFSLVLETHQHMVGDTSLFYSEKCFKPILCFQPFIMFGQYGCNYGLNEFGYKSYDKYFNLYDIDYEPNPIKRLLNLIKELERIFENLNSMNRKQQIDWRFKHLDILMYNHSQYHKKIYFKSKINQTVSTIKSVIANQTKPYWSKV